MIRSVSISALLWLLVLLLLAGCTRDIGDASTCLSCHEGIEAASATHTDCVSCHGGDPQATEKAASHRAMLGPKNPSDPRFWERSCGRCHPYQLGRVRAALMTTNTGMIKNIQETWEGEDGRLYGTQGAQVHDAAGNPLSLQPVAGLDNLAGELYRKFCSLCHVAGEANQVWKGSHGSGCAACHFPYADNATYAGGDPTVHGKWPYSEDHRLAPLPDNRVCSRCHNRSGRIALSYEGLNDGNNGLVPTRDGLPGPTIISGARNATSIRPDIHHAKGMECIDCHTSRDVMGDGYAYENLYEQVEVGCEDCHGSPTERPRAREIVRENEEPVRESRGYKAPVRPGMTMVLTSKGRPYSNVALEEGKVILYGKRDGRRHESKVITGTAEHMIAGHGRLECHSCHSRTVVQCYGCHTEYDQGQLGMDFVKGKKTPGRFSETEDYRTLYPFPLALDQRGRISPVTPGCQTFVTVRDAGGRVTAEEYVTEFKGKRQLRFAPFYGHNTGTRAVGCGECHGNPAFLGFGQHVVEEGTIEATLLCERSDEKPLDGYLSLSQGRVRAFSAITREGSRPLNGSEVKRVWAVNQCLVCHADPKDPIYQKPLDYERLDACLNHSAAARP
ncbi:selenite/tellurite reduction operon c-type cytochrome ExtM [uncultured Desulfuromonas sp.]|uniref:selenite/tellurite reduction operon c-type cytochrome ExtM n=2 Tax=Desulfuromonas TaxID=890 RepID=UPI0026112490|nr:selenite/tellurite reduction operon c-type cytochrome ExtM [uncultured Desulfuromonas sp.]